MEIIQLLPFLPVPKASGNKREIRRMIREEQMKATRKYHLTPSRSAISKHREGQVEKLEHCALLVGM